MYFSAVQFVGDLNTAIGNQYNLKEIITTGMWNSSFWNGKISNCLELQGNTWKESGWTPEQKTAL